MDKQKFRTPVVIYAGRPTRFCLVATVSEASDFLFDNWAENDSQRWTDAMNQCAGATMGMTSVDDANSAFLAAITGAGMRIDPAISRH